MFADLGIVVAWSSYLGAFGTFLLALLRAGRGWPGGAAARAPGVGARGGALARMRCSAKPHAALAMGGAGGALVAPWSRGATGGGGLRTPWDSSFLHTGRGGSRFLVAGALNGVGAAVEDVGVDHGARDVGVAEQFLDGADVVTRFQQVGCEAVAEGVAGGRLRQAGAAGGRGVAD